MVVKADGAIPGMIRAAGYGRVSTEEQANEGHSLEAQREFNLGYINNEKWLLAGYFEDPGYSGKNLKRPEISRLLNEIKAENIDAVVVHKLDRLTRDIKDLYELLQLFEEKNVKLVSISEKIDTSSAMGRMFVFMLGIFAQWYRENLAEEVTKGMRKRAQKGLHNITVNLYGYVREADGALTIKEEEAKWVRWIFEKYVSGVGSTNIAKQLNELGIRRNQGAQWDQHKVMMTLTNHHYVGKTHWKSVKDEESIIREGAHDAIISDELFERAQRLLARRREGLVSMNSYEYVLGGLLRCGSCGGKYKGKYNKKTGRKLYRAYVCSNFERYGTCDQGGVSEDKIIALLFRSMDLIGQDYTRKDMPERENTEEEEIRKSLRESEARRERWQMAYGDGNMPYEDFSRRMKEEMARVSELEDKLSTIPQQVVSYLTPDEAVNVINGIKEHWGDLEQSTRKEIIQSLFQEIQIRKEGKTWSIDHIILA